MAWTFELLRTDCGEKCSCYEIPETQKAEFIMYDYHEVNCESYRHLPIRHGFLFKIPSEMWDKYEVGQPDSLQIQAFKSMCILTENLVRNKYGTCKVLKRRIHYHYQEFLETERQLREEFGIRSRFSEALLPRLGPIYDNRRPFTGNEVAFIEEMQQNFPWRPVEINPSTRRTSYPLSFPGIKGVKICMKHEKGNFSHLYRLRCREVWAPKYAYM